jgi:hypothetical protein
MRYLLGRRSPLMAQCRCARPSLVSTLGCVGALARQWQLASETRAFVGGEVLIESVAVQRGCVGALARQWHFATETRSDQVGIALFEHGYYLTHTANLTHDADEEAGSRKIWSH